jgi:hypothetical protein
MVKAGKKTKTQNENDKNKENPEIFFLMRDMVTNAHHIVQRSKVITSKKLEKLHCGDEVGFGQRNNRIRGIILMTGKIYLSAQTDSRILFVLGTENQCKNSLLIIEKASAPKNKTNKAQQKKIIEEDSDEQDVNDMEANESDETDSEEEVNLDRENEVLEDDEETLSNDIHISNSFIHSQSVMTIKFFSKVFE